MRYVILILVTLKTAVLGIGRGVPWYMFTDISKTPAASNMKLEQPPIYSAGEGSRIVSSTSICHHILGSSPAPPYVTTF
jgi:hypothetical protein